MTFSRCGVLASTCEYLLTPRPSSGDRVRDAKEFGMFELAIGSKWWLTQRMKIAVPRSVRRSTR